MMQKCATSALLMILLAAGCNDSPWHSLDDVGLESWESLEAQLRNALPKEGITGDKGVHDYAFDVRTMRRIRDRGSLTLWLEMCRLRECPLTATGGYLCVAARAPDHRLEAAMHVLNHRPDGASVLLYFPPIMFLREEVQPSPANLAAFSRFVTTQELHRPSFDLALSALSESLLSVWASSDDAGDAPPAVQAIAVDAAMHRAKTLSEQPDDKVLRLLDSFMDTNDHRRLVWLTHASAHRHTEAFRDAVVFALRYDDIEPIFLYIALQPHLDYIKTELDLESLHLTESQRARVSRLLALRKDTD